MACGNMLPLVKGTSIATNAGCREGGAGNRRAAMAAMMFFVYSHSSFQYKNAQGGQFLIEWSQ